MPRGHPANRESQTREATARKTTWKPSKALPDPDKQEGYAYRWVRTSTMGQADTRNVSAKFREGWEPVKAEEHPELQIRSDKDSDFPDGIEVGGLLLCKNSKENMDARREYHADYNAAQLESVDNQFLRENDPRMPLSRPERRTRISFGTGSDK